MSTQSNKIAYLKPQAEATMPKFSTDTLFNSNKLIEIFHRGERYIMRITRQDKLILTK